jgi:hypothetical protein
LNHIRRRLKSSNKTNRIEVKDQISWLCVGTWNNCPSCGVCLVGRTAWELDTHFPETKLGQSRPIPPRIATATLLIWLAKLALQARKNYRLLIGYGRRGGSRSHRDGGHTLRRPISPALSDYRTVKRISEDVIVHFDVSWSFCNLNHITRRLKSSDKPRGGIIENEIRRLGFATGNFTSPSCLDVGTAFEGNPSLAEAEFCQPRPIEAIRAVSPGLVRL